MVLLPGPPSELMPMFEETCIPRLRKLAGDMALARRIYPNNRPGGIGARRAHRADLSKVQKLQTTMLAKPGQVDVRLTAAGKTAAEAERAVQELAGEIEMELRDYIFTNTEQSLEEVVGVSLAA